MNNHSSLGILIVGLGMGMFRARGLAKDRGAHLEAVCDTNECRLAAAKTEFGCKTYSSLERALEDPKIECVFVLTPTSRHLDAVKQAAAAGKHVIVTKPLESTSERTREMIAVCEASGVQLVADFEMRYHPLYLKVKAALTSGVLGDLLSIDARCKWFRDASYYTAPRGTWAGDGGGAFSIQGIHLLDQLIWLAGMPSEVWADMVTQDHAIEVEDWGFALMKYADPRVRVTHTSTTTYAKDIEFGLDLHGTRGAVNTVRGYFDPDSPTGEWFFRPDCEAALPDPGDYPRSAAEDLVRALKNGTRPECDGREGLTSRLLLEAIYRSAREGRSVKL